MDKAFWLERWEQGQTAFHLPNVNRHLRRHLSRTGIEPGGRIFVPLCGRSLDIGWLADEGFVVVGVELSEIAAESLFTERGVEPQRRADGSFERFDAGAIRIYCGDYFDLVREQLGEVSTVFDRAALIALPPEARVRYAARLVELLSPGASVLLVTLDYEQSIMSGPPFSVAGAEVDSLFRGRFRIEHLESNDVLDKEPRFKERGLRALTEDVYLLLPI